jgi:hypothetical protein
MNAENSIYKEVPKFVNGEQEQREGSKEKIESQSDRYFLFVIHSDDGWLLSFSSSLDLNATKLVDVR